MYYNDILKYIFMTKANYLDLAVLGLSDFGLICYTLSIFS